jgi:hypothetical protein
VTQPLHTVYTIENNGIPQFYYEQVSQRCGEGKATSISKSTPTPRTDADIAFVSVEQYIIFIKDSEGCVPVRAHMSTVYAG